jgi:hypothetical protein
VPRPGCAPLGRIELCGEVGGDLLRQECASGQGAADGVDLVYGKPLRQLRDEAPEGSGRHEQQIEVEPQVAVVAGLQSEMSPARGQRVDQLVLHPSSPFGHERDAYACERHDNPT